MESDSTLSVAYSPCPNDTFAFHSLAAGTLCPASGPVEVYLHDVETLNRLALQGRFDVSKVSFPAYLAARESYELLSAGAAVGHGCGPIVVSARPRSADDLPHCRVAVPGEHTTAHLLLRLWAPEIARRSFVPYHEVMSLVASGEADCGVLIHEGRFVYERHGLRKVVDLGQWWEEQTHLPIPLGCIIARKRLGPAAIAEFDGLLRQSIRDALANPAGTLDYVRLHAQEMDAETLDKHIRMFVNEFTLDLGPAGRAAAAKLEEMALRAGVLQ